MMRAVIVEDEWAARAYLGELLQATGRVQVVGSFGSAGEVSQSFARPDGAPHVDVLFADVRLTERPGDVSGLELVRSLRPHIALGLDVVLTTALAEHALEAYELGVVDYLRKPYGPARVGACVERLTAARHRLVSSTAQPSARVVARERHDLAFLDVNGVLAFEAVDRLSYVHHEQGRFEIDESLAQVEQDRRFGALLRVHRNWLVVVGRVNRLLRASTRLVVVMHGGLEVPVARERAASTRQALLASLAGTS